MSTLLRNLFNSTFKQNPHKKLSEDWATLQDPVEEGVTFCCKYIGSTLVDEEKDGSSTAEAIKRVIHSAKLTGKKPERVYLHVSFRGIKVQSVTTMMVLHDTSVYRISYCSADAHYDNVIAYIAANENDTCECQAFLCHSSKLAQAVAVTIAHAFNMAYEAWKRCLEGQSHGASLNYKPDSKVDMLIPSPDKSSRRDSQVDSQCSSPTHPESEVASSGCDSSGYLSSSQGVILDFDDAPVKLQEPMVKSPSECPNTSSKDLRKPWARFDETAEGTDEVSRLTSSQVETVIVDFPSMYPSEWSKMVIPPLQLRTAWKTNTASWTSNDWSCLPLLIDSKALAESQTLPPPKSKGAPRSSKMPIDKADRLNIVNTEEWETFNTSSDSHYHESCQSPLITGSTKHNFVNWCTFADTNAP